MFEAETVGELRRLIEGLPDDALIKPDWEERIPSDSEPGVKIGKVRVKEFSDGTQYLERGRLALLPR